MHAIVTSPVVPPSRVRPELPPEFDAIVEKAMHRDPAKRFPSLQALGSALLSLGDKTAWVIWESEFIGTSVARELWTGTSTFHDDATRRSEHSGPRPFASPTERRRAPWSRIALIGAAYAVAVLWRQMEPPERDATAAEPMAPTAREIDERLREERLRSPHCRLPHRLECTRGAGSAKRDLGKRTIGPVLVRRREERPNGAKPSPREATSRPTTRAPAPSVVMGTNGAPIVD
jgi:hypothetical protein